VYNKTANMIVKSKNKYILYNKTGTKKLGEFKTKKEAQEREKQIRYFSFTKS
jgi:hypothetical protein